MSSARKYYTSIFVRRLPWFLLVACAIGGVAVTAALVLPPTYASEAQVTIESSQIPDKMIGPTDQTPAIEQLQIFRQRLLTRANLLTIANKLNVLEGQQAMSADEIVKAMLARTNISASAGRSQATLMTLGFEARGPQIAAGVVNEYLTLILQDDAQYRAGRAGQTLDFFNQEVARLGSALDAQNDSIVVFKRDHADALPENLPYMRQQQSNLQNGLAQIDRDRALLTDQRSRLVQVFETTGRVNTASNVALTPEQKQLAVLESDLSTALSIYSTENPKVKMIQAQIDQLRQTVAKQTPQVPVAADAVPDGEVLSPEAALMKAQMSDIDNRLESMDDQQTNLQQQLSTLEEAISRVPANSLALEGLQRDYVNLQSQYNSAVGNQATAGTGERIATLARGERISVIDQPAVPTDPVKPRRLLIAGGGIAAGIAAGLALVVLLEVLNGTARRPVDIVKRLGVTPLATIPYLRTRGQIFRQRAIRLAVVVIVVAAVPATIFAVDTYYMPLDLIGQKIMDKVGFRG